MDYKNHCIQVTLDYIRNYFETVLDSFSNEDDKLMYLYNKIQELHMHDDNKYSSDKDDAYYNCARRQLQEAMDWPIDKLTPLLMENINSEKGRHVSRKLYYTKETAEFEKMLEKDPVWLEFISQFDDED